MQRSDRFELWIIIQKFMKAVDDAHTLAHRFEDKAALVHRQHTRGWCHPINEKFGCCDRMRKGFVKITMNRDPVRPVAKHHARIQARLIAIDHGKYFVRFRMPDKPVGRLAID